MATYRVRSTDGNNADDGSTWALAKADLHTPAWAAGDLVYVSQAHAQSTAAAVTVALAGTLSNPTTVLGVSDAADPPTAVSTGGSVTTTGANGITVTGSGRVSGLRFNCGSGTGSANLTLANTTGTSEAQVYEECTFSLVATQTSNVVSVGASGVTTGRQVTWNQCVLKLASAGHKINVQGVDFKWLGGSVESGSATPTTSGLFNLASRGASVVVSGVDLSNFSSSLPLVASSSINGRATFQNCKLPASWSGTVLASALTQVGFRASLYNCDSGDTNYRLWIEDYSGTIRDETSIVRTGGASDGTTPIAWKMTATASANESVTPLMSDPIYVWNDTTGSSKTLTVEVAHDSATALTDAEAWVEVEYLGTSGFPLGATVSDRRASLLATAAAQASSTAEWPQNLLTYSEQFDNAAWTPSGLSITANSVAAPDGQTTADTLTISGASQGVLRNVTVSASTTYTMSWYVKLGTLAAANYKFATYDNTAGSFIASDIVPTVTPTSDGWVRVTHTLTTPVGCTSLRIYPYRNSAAVSGTVYVWGAVLRLGSASGPYIQTVASTVMPNLNTQKLSVSFTPQEKGFAVARVFLGLASKTMYVCPKATVS